MSVEATVHPLEGALSVAAALRDLGREELRAIEDRRLVELGPIAARRGELVRALEAAWAAGAAGVELDAVLRDVRVEGARNLALLESIKDDLARELEGGARTGRAVRGYAGSSRY